MLLSVSMRMKRGVKKTSGRLNRRSCFQKAVPAGAFLFFSRDGLKLERRPVIAAETVLWPDQPEAYWLTVIADTLGSDRGFRFVRTH